MTDLTNKTTNARISSIDLLRGLVMIIMALDHTRDYFHRDAYLFDPTDLTHTSPIIFFTRWITHFCAPVFVFLAGTSAFISGQKKSKKELSLFLLKRGLWLMILEFTIVNFAWFFNPAFSLLGLQVIWVLGLSMVVLAALIYLPRYIIFSFGIVLITGHNILDQTHVPGNTMTGFLWSAFHEFNAFHYHDLVVMTAYPMIPWVAVMALGYCFGSLYTRDYESQKRRRILIILGSLGIFLFVGIRLLNVYGDPRLWSEQSSWSYTFLSFLNTSKYPPSLLYLLMTLSPAILFLAFVENIQNSVSKIIITFGRVPLFYYLMHIYLLHILAMTAAIITGYHWSDMVFTQTWITDKPSLKGYGFDLVVVYLIWLGIIIFLYPFCKRYDEYKQTHRQNWWLSYL
jgi:uncharacterized membrane protein